MTAHDNPKGSPHPSVMVAASQERALSGGNGKREWKHQLQASALALVRRVRCCLARQAALLRAIGVSQPAQPLSMEPATSRWVRAELEANYLALDTACASLRRVRRALVSFCAGTIKACDESRLAEPCHGSCNTILPDDGGERGASRSDAAEGQPSINSSGSESCADTTLKQQGTGAEADLCAAARSPAPQRVLCANPTTRACGPAQLGESWHRPNALASSVVAGASAGCRRALPGLVEASGRSCGVVMGRQATASKRSVDGAFSALYADKKRPHNPMAGSPVESTAGFRSPKRLRSASDDMLGGFRRKRRAASARDAALGTTAAMFAPAVAGPVALAASCASAESMLRNQFSEAAVKATAMLEALCWQATRRSSSRASTQASMQCCANLFPRHGQNKEAWNNLVSAVASVQALAFEACACPHASE